MRKQLILSIAATLIFTSCSKEKEEIKLPEQIVYPLKSIDQYNDSTFVTRIRDIIEINNNFWMTDFENARIMVIDTGLNLQQIVGRKGRGPGEHICFEKLYVKNNTIYAYDPGKKEMNRYTPEYGILPSIKLNADTRIYGECNFIIDNKNYLWGCKREENRIAAITIVELMQNKTISSIAPPFPNPKYFNIFNHHDLYRIVSTELNKYFFIGENYPVIYQYSKNGEIIDSYDLSKLELFASLIKRTKIQIEKKPAPIYDFIKSVKSYKNKLYLLCYSKDKTNVYCRSILVIDTSKDKIEPEKIITLKPRKNESGWYNAFCLFDNETRIIAMNSTSDQIQIFNLNK